MLLSPKSGWSPGEMDHKWLDLSRTYFIWKDIVQWRNLDHRQGDSYCSVETEVARTTLSDWLVGTCIAPVDWKKLMSGAPYPVHLWTMLVRKIIIRIFDDMYSNQPVFVETHFVKMCRFHICHFNLGMFESDQVVGSFLRYRLGTGSIDYSDFCLAYGVLQYRLQSYRT